MNSAGIKLMSSAVPDVLTSLGMQIKVPHQCTDPREPFTSCASAFGLVGPPEIPPNPAGLRYEAKMMLLR